MINAIVLLREEALVRSRMTTPNANTITEFSALKNQQLAEEFALAAQVLVEYHNNGFRKHLIEGLDKLAKAKSEVQEHLDNKEEK